ncbi:MAG: ADP-ribosylglycohydrolase family protein [Bacteroidota bacterium]
MNEKSAVGALLGVAVADAVGVPFEFLSQAKMSMNPATDMTGYGTHDQPPGTWSDDTSLTLCLAEALLEGLDLQSIASRFVAWKHQSYLTAHHELFDIGNTTSQAIGRLADILQKEAYNELPRLREGATEMDNGNGSLMRIIPLLFYIKGKAIAEQFEIIWQVSALTHYHIRAAMSCLIYLRLAEHLLNGMDKHAAYEQMQQDILQFWDALPYPVLEQLHFQRIIQTDIRKYPYRSLKSGGYVIESIEASLWCFLQKDGFEQAVLAGINLGHDTDTTAAIIGGLGGLYEGVEGIPEFWRVQTARMEDIIDLGEKLDQKYLSA